MIDLGNFKLWLTENKDYSDKTISNIVSRFKRAESMLPWFNDSLYIFKLEQLTVYKELSSTVRSQIKKSVKLYFDFVASQKIHSLSQKSGKLNVLSLFANIGVAEAYLDKIGINIAVANELIERRAVLYSKIYPHTHMICGDITDTEILNKIVSESLENHIDIVMATPPCQGMSTAGQQVEDDIRNKLVCQVIEVVNRLNPKYVFIENVPLFFKTEIEVNGSCVLIPDFIDKELGNLYKINRYVIDTKNYSVPQTRERAILLMTRRDISKEWVLPTKDDHIVTMFDAIGHLPKIDPFVTDINEEEMMKLFPDFYERKNRALSISRWNIPPHHILRQVVAMQHTPTGCTAFDNEKYFPIKENGEAVKGYRNTYKRQNWDTSAYTVTMDNRKISSQNNVHPGRIEGTDDEGNTIYSDARALTLYELMIIMSLPEDWAVPHGTPEAFLRRVIGEGIPPLFVKKVFEQLVQEE